MLQRASLAPRAPWRVPFEGERTQGCARRAWIWRGRLAAGRVARMAVLWGAQAIGLWAGLLAVPVVAGAAPVAVAPAGSLAAPSGGAQPAVTAEAGGLAAWLEDLHQAARQRSYAGTLVVSADGGVLSTARLVHVHTGAATLERVEMLSGAQRVVFRSDEQVVVWDTPQRLVRVEPMVLLSTFPDLKHPPGTALEALYHFRAIGVGRVAGHVADGYEVWPRDALRFAQKVWRAREGGLVLRRQILDAGSGRVLEETSFTELSFQPVIHSEVLAPRLELPEGFRLWREPLEPTSLEAEGWRMDVVPEGFALDRCVRRHEAPWRAGAAGEAARDRWVLQCIWTDGLAAVSVFIEPYEARRHGTSLTARVGATQMRSRPAEVASPPAWWLTAVGEVPLRTLDALLVNLRRVGR